MDDRPIGMFDSGFGGLTVARAMIDLLPAEKIVYLGDSDRYPYGPRDPREVRRFSREIVDYLVNEEDVKMVVVACNTASAAALSELRYAFDVPIIGVLEPGLRAAARVSKNQRIGVIGTVGTVASGAYQRTARQLRVSGNVYCNACPGFVEFVERGEIDSPEVRELAFRLLTPLRDQNIDTLLLGCTHYPFLARTIADVMGRDVVLVSSADETAFDVLAIIEQTGLGSRSELRGQHRFLSTGDVGWFVKIGQMLFGSELDTAEHVQLGAPRS